MEPQGEATTKTRNRITILIEAFRCCFTSVFRDLSCGRYLSRSNKLRHGAYQSCRQTQRSARKKRRVIMQARLLLKRFSQVAILAKAAYLNRAVQSSVPTAAYLQHLFSSPLHFVVKAVGPAMAPTINDGVAERAVGHVRAPFTHKSNPALSQLSRRSFSVQFLCSILFVSAT